MIILIRKFVINTRVTVFFWAAKACDLMHFMFLCQLINRSEKEMNRRKDNLANLRSKVNQMASTLNMSNFANRDSLLGPEIKPDAMSRTVGLDNNGLVGLQRQVMKGNFILNCVNLEIYSLCFGYWFRRLFFKQSKMRALRNWRRPY